METEKEKGQLLYHLKNLLVSFYDVKNQGISK